ncbi:MAG: ATP-dependent 6-phosphofructokinase [Victivallales bacterium]|nr:ATP-dependent 6-phosphofructokinase [Victivallales bacterium]
MDDMTVKTLGAQRFESPVFKRKHYQALKRYVGSQNTHILADISVMPGGTPAVDVLFEKSVIPEKIFFDPSKTRVAIVSCGGICPGINDVIRSIVLAMYYWYEVKDVIGIRFGYAGLGKNPPEPPVPLSPDSVSNIHDVGGTVLASSRGCPPEPEIVDSLVALGVDILFCIGGDGTLRGAHDIHKEVEKRKLPICVVGIPKTIDNDVFFVYRSFGYQTAVAEAKKVLSCAHVEAKAANNGIGLVKLMGREAGFIAAAATKASGDVNFCLVPEIRCPLHGEGGVLETLRDRILRRHHAVIAVAEGAGNDIVGETNDFDASGNKIFKDIGTFLRDEIKKAFKQWQIPVNVKYIDPSYVIRSVPANSDDSIFCADLARAAVNSAMSGKTDMLVGFWHGEFTCVPLEAVRNRKKRMCPSSGLWHSVIATTGQPSEWI